MRHEVGDSAGTGVEVKHQLLACQPRKIACYLVELVGLQRVGLVEGFRTNLELQILHFLHDMVLAVENHHVLIAYRVVVLTVHHV